MTKIMIIKLLVCDLFIGMMYLGYGQGDDNGVFGKFWV
jgi:hypothetical protein